MCWHEESTRSVIVNVMVTHYPSPINGVSQPTKKTTREMSAYAYAGKPFHWLLASFRYIQIETSKI